MNRFLVGFLFLFPLLAWTQPTIQRNPATTNAFMNLPSDLQVPFWNAAANKWSNAPIVASPNANIWTNNGITVALIDTNKQISFGRSNTLFTAFGSNSFGLGSSNRFILNDDASLQNVALGETALQALTVGSLNTAIGYQALFRLVTGNDNTMVGVGAGFNVTSDSNTGVGKNTLDSVTSGSFNTAVGAETSDFLTTKEHTTAIGYRAGHFNEGDKNTFLGDQADIAVFGSGITNTVAIGYLAKTTADNQMVLGSNITTYLFRNRSYQFPPAQGFYDSFLRNDGTGALDWTNALQNLTVISNFTAINNTVLSNVTVKGDLIITNIIMGGVNLRTNQYTTNVSSTPVIGSFWFQGTNGVPVTNNARVAMEWIPVMRSWRLGELGANGAGPDVFDSTTLSSNYWHPTNVGFGSIAQGSNVMAKGPYSFIANGIYNITHSNAVASSIGGGSNNIIYTNATFSVIGGGSLNTIQMGSDHSTLGGGNANDIIGSDFATVAGGFGNDINNNSTSATIGGGSVNVIGTAFIPATYATIAGGRNNAVRSSDATIAGGQGNNITATAATHAFIGGGQNNDVLEGSIYGIVVGGQDNNVGETAVGASTHGFIGGGQTHRINGGADYGVIVGGKEHVIEGTRDFGQILGGASNYVGQTMVTVVGNFVTNTATSSVDIGHGANGGNNRKLRVDANGARVMTYNGSATVGGTYLITNTPIASAGAAETNLQVVTIGAHVLTNNNDRLLVRGSGNFAATSNTKQIQLVYGSEDVFDSGAFVANTGAWTIDCEIIRTGNTAQSCNCSFNGGTNVVYVRTSSLDTAQTNGIATVLKITGTAAGNGDITNRTLTVEWRPSP